MKIHGVGWPFIAIFLVINLVLFLVSRWAGFVFLPLTLWCVAFFRDPDRRTPEGAGLIISPADGVLLPIVSVPRRRRNSAWGRPRAPGSAFS